MIEALRSDKVTDALDLVVILKVDTTVQSIQTDVSQTQDCSVTITDWPGSSRARNASSSFGAARVDGIRVPAKLMFHRQYLGED